MFHTLAYGGSNPEEINLFQQVIAQSPGPLVGYKPNQGSVGNAFLRALYVTTVVEARRLPTEVLIKANADLEAALPYFGPFVDGDLIPDLPARLYRYGRYIKGLNIMSGHNTNEDGLFIPPSEKTQTDIDAFIHSHFPTVSAAEIHYINH